MAKKLKGPKNLQKARAKIYLIRNLFKRRWPVVVLLGALLFLFIYLFKDLPSPTKLTTFAYPVSTQILDRNGLLLYEIYADQNRTPIKLTDLPVFIGQATIAIEDKDFYTHGGIDLRGITRAFINTVFHQELQGGSTITQQLVKNALLTQERTLRRKIREFFLTEAVEFLYSKNQILEMYLNQIPYGGTAYGIESAAHTYFDKDAKDLTLPEAALLAGLTQAPTHYSPFGAHPELAKSRQLDVLKAMVTSRFISREQESSSAATPLVFASSSASFKAPHFVLWVKELLAEKYGEPMVEQGGLIVTTSLDSNIQEGAEKIVQTEISKLKSAQVTNGAALVTRPATGEILAMVGSHDFNDREKGGNVNVTLAQRQPGSAIKPLNYALGLLTHRITPATPLIDIPTCFSVPGQPLYCPVNYDGQFHGDTQVRFDLGNSFNIPAVKMLYLNTLPEFIATASAMGISTFTDPEKYGLSLTLGGGEVKMTDLSTAYGVLANGGVRQDLISILKIASYKGQVLEETEFRQGPRVLPMDVAYLISHILLDNNARSAAFGPSSYLVVPNHPEISVKTGTTNDKRDNWTLGYNQDLLVATWVGNNDNSPMNPIIASGVTGASPIWNKIISFALSHPIKPALKNAPPPPVKERQAWPIKPDSVVGKEICVLSGLLPPNPAGGDDSAKGCQTRFEYFQSNNLPTQTESLHRQISVYKDTRTPVQPGENPPPDQIQTEDHPVVEDPTGAIYCLDCPIPTKPITLRYPPPAQAIRPSQPPQTPPQ